LVEPDHYELVYSFGHHQPKVEATYLQIHYDEHYLKLALNHRLRVKSKGYILALQVDVGQSLLNSKGNFVTLIQTVSRRGLYGPFTTTGTLVVNGVQASSYVAVIRGLSLLQQWLAHVFIYPLRRYC